MNRITVMLLCLVLLLSGTSASTAVAASRLTASNTSALVECLQQEYLMHDTYQNILAKYPTLTTFGAVAADEMAMIATLKKVFAKYKIAVPADNQVAAAQTIASTATSISMADTAAISLEQSTATLMTQLLGTTDNRDVAAVETLIQTTSLGSHTTAFTAEQASVATPAPTAHDIYGPGIAADALANEQVGGPSSGASNSQVGFKFMATTTGTLLSFREYWIDETYVGYGGGNGGTIRVTLQADDGSGFPSGTVLATKDIVGPADGLQQYSFTSPPSLTAGVVYHLVHTNIDSSPTVNFVSLDSLWYHGAVNSPCNPGFSDVEYGQTAKYGAKAWEVSENYTPILMLAYGGGITQGMGYMETSNDEYATINGVNNMARESFTVTGGDRVVTSASVRLRRSAGTGALVVRLETSGGSLIEAVNVSAASIPTSAPDTDGGAVWVTATFSSSHTLANGSSYNLHLSTDDSTTYTLFTIRKGFDYDFAGTTYFKDGSAFKTTNGSTWTNLGRVTASPPENDIQFYFKN